VLRSFVWCLFAVVLAGCGGGGGSVSPTSGNGQNFQSAPFSSAVPLSSILTVSGKFGTVMSLNFTAPSGEFVRSYAGAPLGLQTPLLTDNVVDGFTATFGPSAAQVESGCALAVMTDPPPYGGGPYIRVVDVTDAPPVKVGDVVAIGVPPGVMPPSCAAVNAQMYTLAPGRTYAFILSTSP
jgi:hypothetical protein